MKRIKHFFCITILAFAAISADAQSDSATDLPNFLFPRFTRCTIKFKSGDSKTGIINYNIIDEEVVFLEGDKYMVLDNPSAIDTIYMDNRKFIPFKAAFYEVVLTGTVSLFIQHKSIIEDMGTPTGYGATTKTSNSQYVRQVYGPIGSSNLSIPDNLKITDNTTYWVRKDSSMEKFINKRQFLKIFKDKEKELNKFIDSNSSNFKKPDDVVRLCNYCAGLFK